jgi:hypothetical protein|nr:hypothetical protein [Kofleriaceae bacterium]
MPSASRRLSIIRALALVGAVATPALADNGGNDFAIYGDIDGVAKTTGTRTGTSDGFSAAKLDLFTTRAVERWTFLSEVMFEADSLTNSFGLDVERVEVGYLFSNWLRVNVGRFHTALGYYNDAYHHGVYFMTAIARPQAIEFEDGGGLIPAHNVGVHVDGRFPIGDDHIRYDFELANGRSPDQLVIQNQHDDNRPKAVNLRVRYEPSGLLDGLIVGGNIYFDSISAADPTATPATTSPVHVGALHEWIVGAHAAYFEHDFQVIAEALMIQHDYLDTGARQRTYTEFAELGHSWGNVTPYVRYERTRYPSDGDPYFQKVAADGYDTTSLGVKHTTSENIALKLQTAVSTSPAAGSDPVFSIAAQVSFAF